MGKVTRWVLAPHACGTTVKISSRLNDVSAYAMMWNRLDVRRFRTNIAGRRDLIGLRFEARGLLHQQGGQFGVVCLTRKIQQRRHLTRQIRLTDHHGPPNKRLPPSQRSRTQSVSIKLKLRAAPVPVEPANACGNGLLFWTEMIRRNQAVSNFSMMIVSARAALVHSANAGNAVIASM